MIGDEVEHVVIRMTDGSTLHLEPYECDVRLWVDGHIDIKLRGKRWWRKPPKEK
jgi:hypothetical protein